MLVIVSMISRHIHIHICIYLVYISAILCVYISYTLCIYQLAVHFAMTSYVFRLYQAHFVYLSAISCAFICYILCIYQLYVLHVSALFISYMLCMHLTFYALSAISCAFIRYILCVFKLYIVHLSICCVCILHFCNYQLHLVNPSAYICYFPPYTRLNRSICQQHHKNRLVATLMPHLEWSGVFLVTEEVTLYFKSGKTVYNQFLTLHINTF